MPALLGLLSREAAAPLGVWTTSLESHYHGDADHSDDSSLVGETNRVKFNQRNLQ